MTGAVVIDQSGFARRTKRLVVVDNNGIARQVKRGLTVDENGIARQWWPPITLEYQDWVDWNSNLQSQHIWIDVGTPVSQTWTFFPDGNINILSTPGGTPSGPYPDRWGTLSQTTGSDYLIKCDFEKIEGSGAATYSGDLATYGTWFDLSVQRQLIQTDNVIDDGLTSFFGTMTIARNDPDNPGSPLAGTEVAYAVSALLIQWGIGEP